MQVLCMATDEAGADLICETCGQKYAVYYSRRCEPECEKALEAVRVVLQEHHAADASSDAHPGTIFNVPAWSGSADMSGAALLSGAPVKKHVLSSVAPSLHAAIPEAGPVAAPVRLANAAPGTESDARFAS